MSGPLPPPADHHIGAILALHRRYNVANIIEGQLQRSCTNPLEVDFSIPLRVAAFLLDSVSATDCLVWLIAFVVETTNIETAALRVENLLRIAEHLGRQVPALEKVAELEHELTIAVTNKHLGQAASPPEFDLRLMARNTMAEATQTG